MNSVLTDRRALEREAREAAEWRGHDMHSFVTDSPTSSHAHCRSCGRGVWVDTHPAPNGIDIAGEAVALNCGGAGG